MMLLARVVSATFLIPVILALLYFGGLATLVLALVVAVLGYHEFCTMFRRSGMFPSEVAGLTITVALLVTTTWPISLLSPLALPELDWTAFVIATAVVGSLIYSLFVPQSHRVIAVDWALSLAGACYIGGLLRHGLLLRNLDDGLEWAMAVLLMTWAADTGAYFAGKAFGTHKFWPRVSPSKTWEGVAGGFLLTLVAALVLGQFLLHLPAWQSVLLGLLIAGFSILGDLAESLLKRAAGVKDSGILIPGHGGILDRIDSILFVLPVAYYFALFAGP